MAVAAASATQLGCGRDIDQVWDHLDRAPDAHELTCPYCQAARADLADLARATARLREDDANNPDLTPSPRVLDRVLAVARAEVRRGRRLPLDAAAAHKTHANTVSEQAVSAVIRRVGDRTAHFQVRRCAVTLVRPAKTSTASLADLDTLAGSSEESGADPVGAPSSELRSQGPATVTVSLRVSAAPDVPIVDSSSQLRRNIIDTVNQEVGMNVSRVDITIEDLHDV